MPDRRAQSRLRRMASRLPAVLLSGLFLFVTAGLPGAAATSVPGRELSVEPKSGAATISAGYEIPDAVIATAPPTSQPGIVPRATTGAVVDPRDLHRLQTWGGPTGTVFAPAVGPSAHHDRAPPVTGEH